MKNIKRDADQQEQRVTVAFQLALSRVPTSTEIDQALEFIQDASESLAEQEGSEDVTLRAWAGFCQALFVSNEFRHVQ